MAKQYEPLTAVQVENEIVRLSAMLEAKTNELSVRARTAAETEAAHKSARASKNVHAKLTLTVNEKPCTDGFAEVWAESETENLLHDRLVAEAVYASLKESIYSIRAQLSALQTISANIRGQV